MAAEILFQIKSKTLRGVSFIVRRRPVGFGINRKGPQGEVTKFFADTLEAAIKIATEQSVKEA